jgi:hypothetical protein
MKGRSAVSLADKLIRFFVRFVARILQITSWPFSQPSARFVFELEQGCKSMFIVIARAVSFIQLPNRLSLSHVFGITMPKWRNCHRAGSLDAF